MSTHVLAASSFALAHSSERDALYSTASCAILLCQCSGRAGRELDRTDRVAGCDGRLLHSATLPGSWYSTLSWPCRFCRPASAPSSMLPPGRWPALPSASTASPWRSWPIPPTQAGHYSLRSVRPKPSNVKECKDHFEGFGSELSTDSVLCSAGKPRHCSFSGRSRFSFWIGWAHCFMPSRSKQRKAPPQPIRLVAL